MKPSPGLPWGSAVWLAFVGTKTDRLRISLIGSASMALSWLMLLALLVAGIGSSNGPYSSDLLGIDSMRPAVIVAAVAFVALLATLLAQCARIGGPARDRRLASLRLAGATAADIRRIVACEGLVASGVGTAVGLVVAAVAKSPVDRATMRTAAFSIEERIDASTVSTTLRSGSTHLLPLDVPTPWWALLICMVSVPLIVAVTSQVGQWQVLSGPFSVARRRPRDAPKRWPLLAFALGGGGLVTFTGARAALGVTSDGSGLQSLVVGGFALLTIVGLLLGTAAVSQGVGRWCAKRTSSAGLLLASRRLDASPFTTARTNSALLAVLTVSAFMLGLREYLSVVMSPSDTGYVEVLNTVQGALIAALILAAIGLLVASAEAIVATRSELSAVVAAGIPRRSIRQAFILQAFLPAACSIPVAVISGVAAARGVLGSSDARSLGTVADERIVIIPVDVPWSEGMALIATSWALVILVAWLATGLVSSATDPSELRATR